MTLNVPGHRDLKKILVLNPKGGSGKTTLAINLAGYLAATGRMPALMDFDPQASSTRWLARRPRGAAPIHGIAAWERPVGVTRSFHLRVPQDIRHLVVDTPAAMPTQQIRDFTPGAHAILVPVLPSTIDIHAASRLIADLLLVAKVSRRMGRLAVIANRVRENTLGFRKLMAFLERLQIPIIAALRDSQNYVHVADEGLGIHELPPARVRKDLAGWLPLTSWLELRLNMPLTERDTLRPGQELAGDDLADVVDLRERLRQR